MGWCNGSYVFDDLWMEIPPYIPENARVEVVGKIIEILRNMDWDTEEDSIRDEWPEVERYLMGTDPFGDW